MSSLVFYYNPFNDFNEAFSPRFAPPLCTAKAQCRSSDVTQRVDSFRPRVDVNESEDSNVVTATFELPGLTSDDIAIDLQQNRLTVSGESTTSKNLEEDGYAIRERRSGKFSRTIRLPLGTKPEDVKAKLENGLLTVTFPKSSPEQLPQRISIQ